MDETPAPMMQTQAGDPGAFARLDLARLPSPAFVVDEARLEANCRVLAGVAEASGATMLLALKAFSMWAAAPVVMRHLSGCCASGLWEARLARARFGGIVETFAAGYKASEIDEIAALSDTVVFNSPGQAARFGRAARAGGADLGLRINPEHSEGEVPRYDPAAPGSRLGHPVSQLEAAHLEGMAGLHMHTLCEQDFEPLRRTWDAVAPRLAPHFGGLDWLNLGGGHHITRADYDRAALSAFLRETAAATGCRIFLEPGEAVALDAGILVGEVLDVMENDGPIAILDISATCHMPDVIEAPYRPALLGEPPEGKGIAVRLGGPSCLAGDVIGSYRFARMPRPGDRLAFLDQAHYSMVKTTTFNGVALPAIWLWNSETDALGEVRAFGQADFEGRLS
ncbi:carboxynorspermidine decarboxylase [Paralimibaculum aggregatum]|uniref:Carboxynorspermidine/carboxyspermidine decarboxylase n=1 Tax=Paralimibaculum aggregatum TaxID=3036245 RepID=A0ABQ6LMS3_9RHOB|nr:carboxynorspermidine decarboxylase [Limibaculum sp. NKW23]GMG81944.1 carboxynorspermidine decarboxylase [Limibaculum sp. NKW23]